MLNYFLSEKNIPAIILAIRENMLSKQSSSSRDSLKPTICKQHIVWGQQGSDAQGNQVLQGVEIALNK